MNSSAKNCNVGFGGNGGDGELIEAKKSTKS